MICLVTGCVFQRASCATHLLVKWFWPAPTCFSTCSIKRQISEASSWISLNKIDLFDCSGAAQIYTALTGFGPVSNGALGNDLLLSLVISDVWNVTVVQNVIGIGDVRWFQANAAWIFLLYNNSSGKTSAGWNRVALACILAASEALHFPMSKMLGREETRCTDDGEEGHYRFSIPLQ